MVPAPEILRCDVAAADPAVDAQDVDAVGLAAEHALAVVGQSQRKPREALSVAERRRGGERSTVLGLDETAGALSERRERAEEPGIAEEGRVFEVLRGDEGGRGGARACGDR